VVIPPGLSPVDGKSAGNHGFYMFLPWKIWGVPVNVPLNQSIDYPGEVIQSTALQPCDCRSWEHSLLLLGGPQWEGGKEQRRAANCWCVAVTCFFSCSRGIIWSVARWEVV
jgi:hypothetical protein